MPRTEAAKAARRRKRGDEREQLEGAGSPPVADHGESCPVPTGADSREDPISATDHRANIDQQVHVPVVIGDASALEPVLGKDAGESDALVEGESEGGGGVVLDPTFGNGAGAKSRVLNLGKLGHVVDSDGARRWTNAGESSGN